MIVNTRLIRGIVLILLISIAILATNDDDDQGASPTLSPSSHMRHQHHSRAPKIAFLFLVRYNLPLLEVWEEFFAYRANPKHFNIYVHPTTPYNFPAHSVFHNRTISKHKTVKWGTFGLVEASRLLYEAALLHDPDNQFFVLLSESCIPLYSFSKWYRVLTTSPSPKSVVNACPFDNERAMERDARWRSELDRSPHMKKEFWRKFGEWVMLIRKHAEIIVNSSREDIYWERVPCVDEHFVPSILAMNGVEKETTCSDGFTNVYWRSLYDSHPHAYPTEDISEELFYNLRYQKVHHFHEHPENNRIDMNHQCSGYNGICHFVARKFTGHTKFQLLNYLRFLLIDDRDDVFYNPHDPPLNVTASYEMSFRHVSAAQAYPGYDYSRHLLKKVRRKKPEESDQQELYYLDNGDRRIFPDVASMKFFFHMNDTNDDVILSRIPVITEEEERLAPLRQDPHFYSAKLGMMVKTRRAAAVWFLTNFTRRLVPNMDTLYSLRPDGGISLIADYQLAEIPAGKPIPPI